MAFFGTATLSNGVKVISLVLELPEYPLIFLLSLCAQFGRFDKMKGGKAAGGRTDVALFLNPLQNLKFA